MNAADFEKLAGQLAEIATSPAFEKTANPNWASFLNSDAGRYLIGGVGGAGAGAILGAFQPDKQKKLRNTLYYGALGGLGGMGLAHLTNSLAASQAPAAAAGANSPAARAKQQKAEAITAGAQDFAENAPTAGAVTGAAAGFGANRYVGKPIGDAVKSVQRAGVNRLTAADAARKTNLGDAHTREFSSLNDPFKAQLLAVKKQHGLDLTDFTAKAHAAEALTGVPAQRAINQFTAQQKAQIQGMQQTHNGVIDAMGKRHHADYASAARKFRVLNRALRGSTGLLGLAARIGIPTAATYGGFHAPDAAQQYISGE